MDNDKLDDALSRGNRLLREAMGEDDAGADGADAPGTNPKSARLSRRVDDAQRRQFPKLE